MLLTEAFQCVPDTPPPGYLSEEGETTDSQDMGKLSFLPLATIGGIVGGWRGGQGRDMFFPFMPKHSKCKTSLLQKILYL